MADSRHDDNPEYRAMTPRFWLSTALWRSVLIVAGVAVLLWSGIEDIDATGAAFLGLTVAISATMLLLLSRPSANGSVTLIATIAGALTGAAALVITAALMLFKNLRHMHPFPDFPAAMIAGMLERMPHWMLAGVLAGFGIGLLHRTVQAYRTQRKGD